MQAQMPTIKAAIGYESSGIEKKLKQQPINILRNYFILKATLRQDFEMKRIYTLKLKGFQEKVQHKKY